MMTGTKAFGVRRTFPRQNDPVETHKYVSIFPFSKKFFWDVIYLFKVFNTLVDSLH